MQDAAALDYEWTHHNWYDKAFATVAEGRLELDLTYQCCELNTWRYDVVITDDDGAVVFGPLELLPR